MSYMGIHNTDDITTKQQTTDLDRIRIPATGFMFSDIDIISLCTCLTLNSYCSQEGCPGPSIPSLSLRKGMRVARYLNTSLTVGQFTYGYKDATSDLIGCPQKPEMFSREGPGLNQKKSCVRNFPCF